jgi:RsiW-degrading membrane proteinase PrsW (M82 family)
MFFVIICIIIIIIIIFVFYQDKDEKKPDPLPHAIPDSLIGMTSSLVLVFEKSSSREPLPRTC